MDRPLCHFIATGGTIAMRTAADTGAAVPALSAEDLVAALPALAGVANLRVTNHSNLPSDEMGPPQWLALRQAVMAALEAPDIAGIVISHGTDTLEETAWFLELTLAGDKPVVLVGAQRNASEHGFDGPRNLLAGVRTAIHPDARGRGVLVVMNDRICGARGAGKAHTTAVEAFVPGEAGFLGAIDGAQVRFFQPAAPRLHVALQSAMLPRVEIVPMYAGADRRQVDQAVRHGCAGVVVQALGLGNVNADLQAGIADAVQAGVTVVVASRCGQGRVRPAYGFPGGGYTLAQAGALFAGDLSPQKARIATMLGLQAGLGRDGLARLFDVEASPA